MRPPTRQADLVQMLRKWIIEGRVAPGSQLPSRAELSQQFAAGTLTMQRALERLTSEGFIDVEMTRGTFVAHRPPHLYRYALLFRGSAADVLQGESRFQRTLVQEAPAIGAKLDVDIIPCHGVMNHHEDKAWESLVQRVRTHQYAGLIFAEPLAQWHLLDKTDLPCVGFTRRQVMPSDHVSLQRLIPVNLDRRSMMEMALQHLAQRKRRRVGFIRGDHGRWPAEPDVLAAVRKHGLETEPAWIQGVNIASPHWARNAAMLFMQLPPARRPDGLIILDDNFVDHALAGLIEIGVRVPEDLDVVGYCNFPSPTAPALPIRRIGFDIPDVLTRCIKLLQATRAGKKPPREVTITAVDDRDDR